MNGTAAGLSLRQLGLTVYLPSAVWSTGYGAVVPVIALTAAGLGASIPVAAVVAGRIGVGQLAGALPAGVLIDRFGERRVMLAASGLVLPALAGCLLARHVLVLAAAIFLVGLTGAAWGLARQAYVTEAVRPDLRARAMSTLGGIGRVGTFLGPFLGAGAMHLMGLAGAYAVALILAGAAAVLVLLLPPVPHDRPAATGADRPRLLAVIRANGRTLRTLGPGVLLVGALRATRQTILPLWGFSLGLDPATIGLIYGLSGAVDMLLFCPAGRLMDRHGRRWAAVPAMALLGLALLLLPLASGPVGLTLAGLLMGVGNGLSAGLIMTVGADVSPVAGRAQFLGAWRVCSDIGTGGCPLAIGAIAAAASLTAAALVAGSAGLVAAALFHRWLAPGAGPPVRSDPPARPGAGPSGTPRP